MMRDHHSIEPWISLSVRQGNALQVGGLLGAALLARIAAWRGPRGGRWLIASWLLAYFCNHALAHWAAGRLGGIRFSGYGLHGSGHAQLYPPPMRWLFARLPFLSARTDPASRKAAPPIARAAMYAAGTGATLLVSSAIVGYGLRHRIAGARVLMFGSTIWMIGMLIGERVWAHGDLRRAWRALESPR